MASMFAYSVRAKFEREELTQEWIDWLAHGHLQDVVNAGATHAMVVRLGPLEAESRYRFPDEAAFKAYEAGPAVALRAEGLTKFPPARGITMTRSSGLVVAEAGRA